MEIAAAIIFLLVIIFTMINARAFNPIHGVISFFGIAILLDLILYIFVKANLGIAETYSKLIKFVYYYIVGAFKNVCGTFHINFMTDDSKVVFFVVGIGIWVISYILSFTYKHIKEI